jgi:hypothetical protein
MAHFIYIFVIIFCSVHARAQYREIEEDRVDALQGVEKTLAVKTAEGCGEWGCGCGPALCTERHVRHRADYR